MPLLTHDLSTFAAWDVFSVVIRKSRPAFLPAFGVVDATSVLVSAMDCVVLFMTLICPLFEFRWSVAVRTVLGLRCFPVSLVSTGFLLILFNCEPAGFGVIVALCASCSRFTAPGSCVTSPVLAVALPFALRDDGAASLL